MQQPFKRNSNALLVCLIISILMLIETIVARVPSPPIFASSPHYPSHCYLPPESGLCKVKRSVPDAKKLSNEMEGTYLGGLLTRYYFDSTTEDCYPFGVQNCGGNENRFETKSKCMETCKIRT